MGRALGTLTEFSMKGIMLLPGKLWGITVEPAGQLGPWDGLSWLRAALSQVELPKLSPVQMS